MVIVMVSRLMVIVMVADCYGDCDGVRLMVIVMVSDLW